jgi:hypothetical protein
MVVPSSTPAGTFIRRATPIPLATTSAVLIFVYALLRPSETAQWPYVVTREHTILICLGILTVTAGYLLVGMVARSRGIAWIGRIMLIGAAVFMLVPEQWYGTLARYFTIWAPLGYLAILVGLAYLTWRQVEPTVRPQYASAVLITVFLGTELSAAAILTDLGYGMAVFFLITGGILAGLHFAKKDKPTLAFRIIEVATSIGVAATLYHAGWSAYLYYGIPDGPSPQRYTEAIIGIAVASVAAVVLVLIFLDRIRLAARTSAASLRTKADTPAMNVELLTALGLTVAFIAPLLPYDWFVDREASAWFMGFPVSLGFMVIALIIVALGFWSRIKPMRLYGLVIVIAGVLKLVTLDIGSVDSVTRVLAFLGGAAVCFAISALYNYASKHFDKELAQEVPPIT